MKGRASEAGKAQNEDCNLQGEKKEGGKKAIWEQSPAPPGSPTSRDLGLFLPDADTEGGSDHRAAACHTSTLHVSQHRPGLAVVFLSEGESSPGQMKFLVAIWQDGSSLGTWRAPKSFKQFSKADFTISA